MNGVATTGPQDPAAKEVNTDSDGKSAGVTAPDSPATASVDDSGSSPQGTAQTAGAEETVSDELPRKRRGILLGTHPGQATPDAVDDGKSLSWMANQAVKATKAVKASQLEQAQAWKAAGMSEDEQSRRAEDGSAAIDAGESVAMPGQEPVQPSPAESPAMTEAVPPVEPSQEAVITPRIPAAGPHGAAAPRVPARMALMLGVLVMFSYAGYRYWFSGDRAASDATATTSDIMESAGPAEEGKLMTPPAISVVAAPEHGTEQPGPTATEAGMAPMPGPATGTQPATATVSDEPGAPAAEEGKLMTPPAISVVAAPEHGTEQPGPPGAEAGMAPVPGPATGTQPVTAGAAPQPAPPSPASAAMPPKAWYPSAVPAAPSPAAKAPVATSQPAPPSSPSPAVEATVPARQPQPAPAARPRYPANGYGYYQPPSSWQPYYQPGYQQAPARR
jgi:hypothetical protein